MLESADEVGTRVRRYYDRQVTREWHRVATHRLAYAISLRVLRDTLPPAARVLDSGGGTGQYAIALAAAGHAVTLMDLSPRLLERARAHAQDRKVRLTAVHEGNAVDLSRFDNASFDAVLLMGPLYHLPRESDRLQALREAHRVLVHGGSLIASFLTRYAPLRRLARSNPGDLLTHAARYETLLATGVLADEEEQEDYPYGYYSHPEEIPGLLRAGGFDLARLLATDGIIGGVDDKVSALRSPAWDAWADLNYDLAEDPGLLASSAQVLAVAYRSAAAPH
jgi:S-adenosylmethionine-dependent methyltransferase